MQVRQLAAYLAQRKVQRAQQLEYAPATVTRVVPVGMGDRACLDLASLLVPGQVGTSHALHNPWACLAGPAWIWHHC
jgi:3-dehydroquinate synthase class II